MISLLERLKVRLDIKNDDEDALLKDILISAKDLFLSLRYPTTPFSDEVEIEPRYNDWILRCAIEMYAKQGGYGQTAHNESGINRTYDNSTISLGLIREITPVVGVT